MIYPHRDDPKLKLSRFENPTAEYRGVPFWSWNGRLEFRQLARQLRVFKEMGFGGVHLHVRIGLEIAYLGDEFMELVRKSVRYCRSLGLRVWLYDEDRWPSGSAGGLVTRDAAYRMRHLLVTRVRYEQSGPAAADPGEAAARSGRSGFGELVRRFAVQLRGGKMERYRVLSDDETPRSEDEELIYVYVEQNRTIPWFNNATYLDTLNPAAVGEFVRVTHERYKEVVGDAFGTTIPAIFTDEPQYNMPVLLPAPASESDVVLPFTPDFDETYLEAYGESFLDRIPEFVWEGERSGTIRYRFFNHATERFASAYADVLGRWCAENSIALTGHLMEEPTLRSQTHAVGEAMRSYRGFHLPGIDLLRDRVELTTAKQAQSVARQYGREGVLSELSGVTGWHFDFRGHKLQGDWQAALGITTRVPHLAWVTMLGEAKRDYPAPIGYQSPWHLHYRMVEDHFARLSTILTRGKATCRIAVIHPIESYWMACGPWSQTGTLREDQDARFQDLTDWLLRNQLDFDFVAESLLDREGRADGEQLVMGAMSYDVVLVPYLFTIRSSTLGILEQLLTNGGKVVVAGEVPVAVDGVINNRAAANLGTRPGAVRTPFDRSSILAAMEPFRNMRITTPDGLAASNLIHQLREDGETQWLFVSHVDAPSDLNLPAIEHYTLRVRGGFAATVYDTGDGSTRPAETTHILEKGERWTELAVSMSAHDSMLLRLESSGPREVALPGPDTMPAVTVASDGVRLVLDWTNRTILPQPSSFTLSEPNVLLLDLAEWRLDLGDWQPEEEVVRLGDKARELLGWPKRSGRMAQPWVEADDRSDEHRLDMRFRVRSEIDLASCSLVLERLPDTTVRIDGMQIPVADTGFWVDESLRTIAVPPLGTGDHTVEVSTTISLHTGAEWCYLLGPFGVRVQGRQTRIEPLPENLCWGDITRQGFPFYAGNITYHVALPTQLSGPAALQIADFTAPVLDVEFGGKSVGRIGWSPYTVELGNLPHRGGDGRLAITVYGNRENAFGPVHNAHRDLKSYGPSAWRTTGAEWTYEYRLEPTGILSAPVVLG